MSCHGCISYLAGAAVTDQDELEGRSFGHVEVVCTRRAPIRVVMCFVGLLGVSGRVATTRFSVARVVLWMMWLRLTENLEGTDRKGEFVPKATL